MLHETAFSALHKVSKIKSRSKRIEEFRKILSDRQSLGIVIQYTYHPKFIWDLPEGDLPDSIAVKSGHSDPGPFYYNIKKLYQFNTTFNAKKDIKERNFISIYESVSSEDADLLMAMKEKKLPWVNLNEKFCMEAVPELFPPVEEAS